MSSQVVSKTIYLGLLLVALATLMLEISLTRIFSVSIGYHFAFLAVSLAMFGMTSGAVIVFLFPDLFAADKRERRLGWSALFFGVTVVAALLLHLVTPITMTSFFLTSMTGVFAIAWTCVVIAVPFVFSGIFVSAILTQFAENVPSLYATDLFGAALACPLVIILLNFTDGPTAVLSAALIATAAAGCLALRARSLLLGTAIVVWAVCLGLLVLFNVQADQSQQAPWLRLVWLKGKEDYFCYDRWNSFSRIRIVGRPEDKSPPFGWGLSPNNPFQEQVHQLNLDIDASAGSVLTGIAGTNPNYLKYDISNMVHYLRHDASVLVIGVGGGRDVLSALAFDQKSVLGVELNSHILEAVNGVFGDYTGHLDRNPKVRFVNDEARSYVTRSNEKFDIIQISLIDTWAATASGVFALAENALYTREAFATFLSHLNDDGILSISRWYFTGNPSEIYRLVSLTAAALRAEGVENPRANLLLIRSPRSFNDSIGTLLISKKPYSAEDLVTIDAKAKELGFEIVLSPSVSVDPALTKIVETDDWRKIDNEFTTKIAPPTDDCPYFFQMLKPANMTRSSQWWANIASILTLSILITVQVLMVVTCIFVPLVARTGLTMVRGNGHLFIFFACIGVGFMLMEMSMMQRLTVFLGHPIYGLSVVLFSLLVSSGIGSFLTAVLDWRKICMAASTRMFLLFAGFIVVGIVCPQVLERCQGAVTPLRIALSCSMLAPLGLLAGMAFPTGVRAATSRAASLIPWLWAINGGASVLAASIAMLISVNFGTNVTYWTASLCYLFAGLIMLRQR